MKFYLVGGAVRDHLLNYPAKERDWLVIGGRPEDLLKQGFQKVGSDFPVFLHPETKEEYALARKERKSAPGYHGFVCDFDPGVSIEEDLMRRDLTINAMAMDDNGHIIDPYHGQEDLKNKCLRHVSPAFVEDPVRVLRVARFAARYYHLGFHLADETRQLIYQMQKQGELRHLVAERVWQEWRRSLEEPNPEQFIKVLRHCGALAEILPEIDALFGVPASKHYHPEVDTGVHTLMVLEQAVAVSNDPLVRFAALVHDLGKAKTPIAQWPKHHLHDERGEAVIEQLCQRLRIPNNYRKLAVRVSRLHVNIHCLFELKASTIVRLLEKADAFRQPALFDKLLTVCEADARGRLIKDPDYPQGTGWRYVLQECGKITSKILVEQGFKGEAIKHELYQRRVACVKIIQKSWKTYEK